MHPSTTDYFFRVLCLGGAMSGWLDLIFYWFWMMWLLVHLVCHQFPCLSFPCSNPIAVELGRLRLLVYFICCFAGLYVSFLCDKLKINMSTIHGGPFSLGQGYLRKRDKYTYYRKHSSSTKASTILQSGPTPYRVNVSYLRWCLRVFSTIHLRRDESETSLV